MNRRPRRVRLGLASVAAAVLLGSLVPGEAAGADLADVLFSPGAAGAGDPYYPLDGNGGYDVEHYDLALRYDPAAKLLSGTATVTARATQNLSAFNLDFSGLTIRSVEVGGKPAVHSRVADELTVAPAAGIADGQKFTTAVRYEGVPDTLGGASPKGWVPTPDGVVVAGEPHGAETWFPVNDHPGDAATYTFRVTVPAGRTAVANGVLASRKTAGGWTTWTWDAAEPMASYLATATIGTFDLRTYSKGGVKFWDAVDVALLRPFAPATGKSFAVSGRADSSYKRLSRTVAVPADGAKLSFSIDRNTEAGWDFVLVEARTAGRDDWTTLPDLGGHTTADVGHQCRSMVKLHPFLSHYLTPDSLGGCAPAGSTKTPGRWSAASGSSNGYERWTVDLAPYAGGEAEVSITYVSDPANQLPGVVVDDVELSAASTSFEKDAKPLDGWRLAAPPAGTASKARWTVGGAKDAPPPVGEIASGSLGRQGEILEFLTKRFGPYPFSSSGGIVHAAPLGFALENQTRPTYPPAFFSEPEDGDSVVVHELAHQWFGDSLRIAGWQHIWLNEGFARYAQWLWAEHEGIETTQKAFDEAYALPADDPFWDVTIGDPGVERTFSRAVYTRGSMTLHQLRRAVGDSDFFQILRTWTKTRAGATVTTADFVALAQEISGKNLKPLFDAWLFTGARPELPAGSTAANYSAGSSRTDSELMQ